MLANLINVAVFDQFPLLKSERLLFREFIDADIVPFYTLRTHEDVLSYMDSSPLENLQASEKMIRENHTMFQNKQGICWAITDAKQHSFMGYFLLWNINHIHARAEIGYALLPKYWGKGFMKETFKIMLPYAFKTLKLHRLEANINPENKRSERLLTASGFKKEGHFKEHYLFNGKFLDSVIYGLLEKNLD